MSQGAWRAFFFGLAINILVGGTMDIIGAWGPRPPFWVHVLIQVLANIIGMLWWAWREDIRRPSATKEIP